VVSTLNKDRTYLNVIKTTYDKPSANIILNGENVKASPLPSGTKEGCLLAPLLFNTVSKVLARAIRQEKERKGLQVRMEENCHSLHMA